MVKNNDWHDFNKGSGLSCESALYSKKSTHNTQYLIFISHNAISSSLTLV